MSTTANGTLPSVQTIAEPGGPAQVAGPRDAARLQALDVFRGITIAGMILVNNPGDWGHIFSPLAHAEWHGLTPTDLVFPFFLFIVGVAMPFSFDRRIGQGASRLRLVEHVVRRSLILFLLGLIMAAFPGWNDIAQPVLRTDVPAPPVARLLLPVWPRLSEVVPYLQAWRGITPCIPAIVGLSLLFADEPPIGWPRGFGPRVRKVIGALLLAGAVAYFAGDFQAFNSPRPRWPASAALPGNSDPPIRVPGVLQRIAVCYLFASLIALATSLLRPRLATVARLSVVILLLGGYWIVVKPEKFSLQPFWAIPENHQMPRMEGRPEGVLHDWIDVNLLGGHLYSERPDPEGILSTLPAIATVLLGLLTGGLLRRRTGQTRRIAIAEGDTNTAGVPRLQLSGAADAAGTTVRLFLAANTLLVAGLWLGLDFPLNKKIWTSSYVLVTAGLALDFLAVCYWLVDVKGYRRWALPFLVVGTNAIAVYFLSSLGAQVIATWPVVLDGTSTDLKTYVYLALTSGHWPSGAEVSAWLNNSLSIGETVARLASLGFALLYVALWCIVFAPLYRLRWFVRV